MKIKKHKKLKSKPKNIITSKISIFELQNSPKYTGFRAKF